MFAMFVASPVKAQTPQSLIPEDAWPNFYLTGVGADARRYVTVEGMPFARAVQLRTAAKAVNPWDISIVYQPEPKVKRGDTLLATFWMRAVDGGMDGRAYTRFVVQRASAPYTKSAEWHLSAGSDWRKVEVPFTMVEDSESYSWSVQFWVSSGPQTLEIGGLSLSNYGPNYPIAKLGLQTYPYDGSAANADWRKDAAARIEQHRKADIAVIVRDANGNPIPGTKVRVNLKKHDFAFGTAVAYGPLKDTGSNGSRYRDALTQWFNKTVLENELKWPNWESNPQAATDSLDILSRLNIGGVRGHTLVWPGLAYLPSDISGLLTQPDRLRKRVADRVTSGAAAIKGRVVEWDVVNEAVTNRDLQRVLGDAELARWFKLARAADPTAKLYINDYSIVTSGGDDLPQQAAYYDLISNLLQQGAPVEGVGIQAHFEKQLTPPARILEILDRFAKLGKDLQITEFDVDVDGDEELQAAYTRDFLTIAFSHPAVRGVLAWGFWEGSHFKPSAAMVRQDWTWKPNGDAWRELIYTKWWTDERGTTDNDGILRLRGFRGDYEVTATIDGQDQTVTASLTGTGTQYVTFGKPKPAVIQAEAGIVNAASLVSGPVAAGEMIAILGSGLGPSQQSETDNRDTQVLVGGSPAQVLNASEGRVVAVLPALAGKIATEVEVNYQGERSNSIWLPITEAAPGIFTRDGSGNGQAEAINYSNDDPTGIPNDASHAAPTGSKIGLLITGEGSLRADGTPVNSLSVRFGSVEGRVLAARKPKPGVLEVQVEVPLRAPTGSAVPVAVGVSGIWTRDGATIAIR